MRERPILPDDAAPKPATPGEGYVEETPSGRFRARVWDPTNPGQRMPSRSFPTRDEAERDRRGMLAVLAAHLADGAPDQDSLQTFGKTWLNEQELSGDLRSIGTLRSQWTAHLSGTELARKALPEIADTDVRSWLDGMLGKKALVPTSGGVDTHKRSTRKLSRDTVSKVLVLLRQILEAARERGLCTANAARDVKVKRVAQARRDDVWTYLKLPEIARLEHCAEIPEPARLVYLVAIYTGLREAELWGLHWRDVTLEGDRPEVVVRYSRRGPPKNGKVRHVPLLAPARELLTRWKAIAPKSEEGLTFPTRTGEMRSKGDDWRWADYHVPTTVKNVRVNVRREGYSKRLKLGRPARFHDLRHTCASHLVMGSWGVQWTLSEIAAFLGHSDTEVTERYAHLSPDHLHAKAAQTASQKPLGSLKSGPALVAQTASPDAPKQLARPRGLEPLTSRSVAPLVA